MCVTSKLYSLQKEIEDNAKFKRKEKEKSAKPDSDESPKAKSGKPFDVSAKDIDAVLTEHKAKFEKLQAEMENEVEAYTKEYDSTQTHFAATEFMKMSKQERMIHAAGHKLAELFENSLSSEEEEEHAIWTSAWVDSSSSSSSTQIHGLLDSMGVPGGRTAKDKEKQMYFEAGAKKEGLRKYMKKVYAFTQAFYKHIGLKELTLYRGVMDDSVNDAPEGEDVQLETRHLSSYTSNPFTATKFGRPVKTTVPVEKVLWSNLTCKTMAKKPPGMGESEIAVMGANELVGKTVGKMHSETIPLEDR